MAWTDRSQSKATAGTPGQPADRDLAWDVPRHLDDRMWLEGGSKLSLFFLLAGGPALLFGLPLLFREHLFGFDHGLRHDFSGKFKSVRQAGEGGSAFPICEMTPAEDGHQLVLRPLAGFL